MIPFSCAKPNVYKTFIYFCKLFKIVHNIFAKCPGRQQTNTDTIFPSKYFLDFMISPI